MTEPLAVVVERVLPYDGPHSADTVREAASGLPALVRYLNNATGARNGEATLRLAPTVDAVLGGLHAAGYGLDQLLRQLADALGRRADDPTLYDDRRDRPARTTAFGAVSYLEDVARPQALGRDHALAAARSLTSHLGHDEPSGGEFR